MEIFTIADPHKMKLFKDQWTADRGGRRTFSAWPSKELAQAAIDKDIENKVPGAEKLTVMTWRNVNEQK